MKPTVMSVPMGSATRTRSQTCPGERLKLQDQAQEEERTGETECVCFTQLYIALVEKFINYNIVFLGRQNQNQKSDRRKAQSTRIGEEERRSGIIGLWFQRSMILSGHKINKKNATKMWYDWQTGWWLWYGDDYDMVMIMILMMSSLMIITNRVK